MLLRFQYGGRLVVGSDLARFGNMNRPRVGGLPHLETFTWQKATPAGRVPYPADRATRLGGLPHLSCKHDREKMRVYMERRVTPPRRVTSPARGPPPPCKQALTQTLINILTVHAAQWCLRLCIDDDEEDTTKINDRR